MTHATEDTINDLIASYLRKKRFQGNNPNLSKIVFV